MIQRFGLTAHRRRLLSGLKGALDQFSAAGCVSFFLDGSFVTAKDHPGDYDACWDVVGVDPAMLDPVFYDFTDFKRAREAQKRKYFGEFFPAQLPEGYLENNSSTSFRRIRLLAVLKESSV